jgi:hypothetical protein
MKQKTEIEKKVEETLGSLEGLQRATPGHFFFTRVQARLHRSQKDVWEKMGAFFSRPVVVVTTISFILLINAWVVFKQAPTAATTATTQNEQAFAEEYNLAVATIYDYNNSNK